MVWYFDACYIRFGAVDYNPESFTNRYMHLTNNSVTKYYEGTIINNEDIEGNMWE